MPRVANDFYATPPWCTRAILRELRSVSLSTVLDPCAGDGAILRVVREFNPLGLCLGLEIHSVRAQLAGMSGAEVEIRDSLTAKAWPASSAIVTNPPYSLASEFVVRALREREGSPVIMLLRLSWLEGQERAPFHRANPSDVYVLPRRPSFTGNGTDSSAYAWFVWGLTPGGNWKILEIERHV